MARVSDSNGRDRRPAAAGDAPVGPASRFVGMRLWWAGVIVGWLGAAVLAVAAWSVYRDYHAHHPGAVLAALVGGLTLGLAAVSVGASWRRAGNRYLRGEASVAEGLTRVAGRWLVRRYGRLPGGRAGKGS